MNLLEGLPCPAAGVDEAGRGPLAGPVTAGAVILDPAHPIPGVGDSKAISPGKREVLFDEIKKHALAWGIGWASAQEIDEINILQATFLAMRRALEQLDGKYASVAVDGNRLITGLTSVPQRSIIKGDAKVPAIGAASILAKVARDRRMLELHEIFPQYGFAKHKGYPTAEHMEALQKYGPCPEHRCSFRPVAEVIAGL